MGNRVTKAGGVVTNASSRRGATPVALNSLFHTLTLPSRSRQQPMLPTTAANTNTSMISVRSMSSKIKAWPTWQVKPPSPIPCGGEILFNLCQDNPYKDAVRFDWKNNKYTYKELNFHSMGLAAGFLETGLLPGDTVLSWLPVHFAEQVRIVTFFKIAKYTCCGGGGVCLIHEWCVCEVCWVVS